MEEFKIEGSFLTEVVLGVVLAATLTTGIMYGTHQEVCKVTDPTAPICKDFKKHPIKSFIKSIKG